jgi:RNA polymerase sigma-70 factor (ECF subfamily)
MLETTEESVTSALKRARAALDRRLPATPPPEPRSRVEIELVERLAAAFELNDVDGMVALLSEDVRLSMPPLPLEYQGRPLTAEFFATVAFRNGRRYRLVPTRANGGQPAFGVYLRDPRSAVAHAFGLLVLGLRGGQIDVITRFETECMARFGLPRTLPS